MYAYVSIRKILALTYITLIHFYLHCTGDAIFNFFLFIGYMEYLCEGESSRIFNLCLYYR